MNLQSTEPGEPIECKQQELGRLVQEEQKFQGHMPSTEQAG
jgi:hypothetical protein